MSLRRACGAFVVGLALTCTNAVALGADARTPAPVAAALATARWTSLGPSPEGNGSFTNSGQVHAIAADPTNADVVYAGADLGGVWRSTDGGSNWTPLTDGLPSASVGAIAIDPSRPTTVYVGFGSQDFEREVPQSAAYGAGVWKSTDGGATWADVSDRGMLGAQTKVIAVDPAAGGYVYVGTSSGLFVSTDGGVSWTEALAGYWTGLAIDPADGAVYAGGQPSATAGAVIERSDAHGQAGTWTTLSDGLPSGSSPVNPILAVGRGSPSVFYVEFIDRASAGLYGLYRSTGGTSWTNLPAAPAAPCYLSGFCVGYGMFSLGVDPTQPARVLFGGIGLYRSTDSGASWSRVCASDCHIHVDQRGLAFGPAGSERVYAANDGGVFRSDDGGATWRSINRGLRITQFYSVAAGPNVAHWPYAYGGTQDNGLERYAGSAQWTTQLCGDTSDVAIDPSHPQTVFVACGDVFRSANGGASWSDTSAALGGGDAYFAHLVMDPVRPQRLVGGAGRVWETSTGGTSWRAISPVLSAGATISAVALAPGSPEVLVAAGSTLQATEDDGASWSAVRPAAAADGYPAVAIAPSDPDVFYVSAGNQFTGTHLYRSDDRGMHWTDVTAGLQAHFVQTVAVDPLDSRLVYVGAWNGPFYSPDGGQTWARLGSGFPNTFVMQFAVDRAHSTLLAATFGRGTYALPLTPLPSNALWATSARVAANGSTTLTGTDGPAAVGQTVIIQRLLAGQTLWMPYATVRADPRGRFSLRVRLTSVSARFRVLLPALGRSAPVVSNTVAVVVRS